MNDREKELTGAVIKRWIDKMEDYFYNTKIEAIDHLSFEQFMILFSTELQGRYLSSTRPTEAEEQKSREQYYIERDEFLIYIEDKVNPARENAGLSLIRKHEAKECFRIIHEFSKSFSEPPQDLRGE